MDCKFQNNKIVIDITVISPFSTKESPILKVIPAIIDTGFTGELQLTYQDAFPLGLSLIGTTIYKLANDQTTVCLQCLGTVSLGNYNVISAIDVKPAGSTLIGLSLLNKLKCKLNIDFFSNKATIEYPKFKIKNKK